MPLFSFLCACCVPSVSAEFLQSLLHYEFVVDESTYLSAATKVFFLIAFGGILLFVAAGRAGQTGYASLPISGRLELVIRGATRPTSLLNVVLVASLLLNKFVAVPIYQYKHGFLGGGPDGKTSHLGSSSVPISQQQYHMHGGGLSSMSGAFAEDDGICPIRSSLLEYFSELRAEAPALPFAAHHTGVPAGTKAARERKAAAFYQPRTQQAAPTAATRAGDQGTHTGEHSAPRAHSSCHSSLMPGELLQQEECWEGEGEEGDVAAALEEMDEDSRSWALEASAHLSQQMQWSKQNAEGKTGFVWLLYFLKQLLLLVPLVISYYYFSDRTWLRCWREDDVPTVFSGRALAANGGQAHSPSSSTSSSAPVSSRQGGSGGSSGPSSGGLQQGRGGGTAGTSNLPRQRHASSPSPSPQVLSPSAGPSFSSFSTPDPFSLPVDPHFHTMVDLPRPSSIFTLFFAIFALLLLSYAAGQVQKPGGAFLLANVSWWSMLCSYQYKWNLLGFILAKAFVTLTGRKYALLARQLLMPWEGPLKASAAAAVASASATAVTSGGAAGAARAVAALPTGGSMSLLLSTLQVWLNAFTALLPFILVLLCFLSLYGGSNLFCCCMRRNRERRAGPVLRVLQRIFLLLRSWGLVLERALLTITVMLSFSFVSYLALTYAVACEMFFHSRNMISLAVALKSENYREELLAEEREQEESWTEGRNRQRRGAGNGKQVQAADASSPAAPAARSVSASAPTSSTSILPSGGAAAAPSSSNVSGGIPTAGVLQPSSLHEQEHPLPAPPPSSSPSLVLLPLTARSIRGRVRLFFNLTSRDERLRWLYRLLWWIVIIQTLMSLLDTIFGLQALSDISAAALSQLKSRAGVEGGHPMAGGSSSGTAGMAAPAPTSSLASGFSELCPNCELLWLQPSAIPSPSSVPSWGPVLSAARAAAEGISKAAGRQAHGAPSPGRAAATPAAAAAAGALPHIRADLIQGSSLAESVSKILYFLLLFYTALGLRRHLENVAEAGRSVLLQAWEEIRVLHSKVEKAAVVSFPAAATSSGASPVAAAMTESSSAFSLSSPHSSTHAAAAAAAPLQRPGGSPSSSAPSPLSRPPAGLLQSAGLYGDSIYSFALQPQAALAAAAPALLPGQAPPAPAPLTESEAKDWVLFLTNRPALLKRTNWGLLISSLSTLRLVLPSLTASSAAAVVASTAATAAAAAVGAGAAVPAAGAGAGAGAGGAASAVSGVVSLLEKVGPYLASFF